MKLPLIIKNLQSTTSHKEKIKIMRDNQHALIMPLYYCYSPFCRFHIRLIPKELKGRGQGVIDVAFYALLSRLTKREITGNEARKTLFNFIEKLHPTYAVLAIQIVKKNLGIGCNVGLINQAFEGELIEAHKVMLAEDYTTGRALEFPVMVPVKIDGVRARYKNGNFYTRSGRIIKGLDHIKTAILFRNITLSIDGELHIPNLDFDTGSGIIRSNAVEKPQVHFALIDVIQRSWNQTQRIKFLEYNFPELGRGFDVEYIPHPLAYTSEEITTAYHKARKRGFEGLVIKNPKALYQEKRSWDWQKMKPLSSLEAKITGVYEGKDGFEGILGGVVAKDSKATYHVGGGFSLTLRKDIWNNPDKYIGRYITIEFMEKTKANNLCRHGVYKSIRWDI